jgi:hypothetical protein
MPSKRLTGPGKAGHRPSEAVALRRALEGGTAKIISRDNYFSNKQDADEFCEQVVRAAKETGAPVKPHPNLLPVESMESVAIVLEDNLDDVKPVRDFWDAMHRADAERFLRQSRRRVAKEGIGVDAEGNAIAKTLHKNLHSNSAKTLDRTLDAFSVLKEGSGVPFIPDLAEILRNPKEEEQLRRQAASRLVEMGKASLPTLIKSLEVVTTEETRVDIADAIGRIGPDAIPTLKDLMLRTDEHWMVRLTALSEFAGLMGDEAEPILSQLVHDEHKAVRAMAARLLEDLQAAREP